MSLLKLKTNLKSLKYGKDQPGGGDSGQPYQQVDINKVDRGFNRFRLTKFDDGLVRGGTVGAINASLVDAFRIGKFLKDLPKGPLFIAKQVGLQLSNPKIEVSKSGRGNVGKLGPTRIYNLGINTLAQVPVNAFGGHLNRHGLSPVQDDQTKYLRIAQENNNEKDNRLTQLRNRFGLGFDYDLYKGNITLRRKEQKTLSVIAATFAGGGAFANSVYNDIQNSRIDDYTGGPSSVYGIGRTLIRRTPERTNDNLKVTNALSKAFNSQHLPEVKISSSFDFGISLITGSVLAKEKFDLIKDTGLNPNESFLNYNVTSYNAFDQAKNNQVNSYTSASNGLRSNRFIRVSNFSSSSLAALKFNNNNSIASTPSNQPSSLNDTTINTFKSPNRSNTTGSRVVSSSAALGISDITGDTTIPNYNNVITYTSNDPKIKYTQLRTQIDNKSTGKARGFAAVSSKISKSGLGAKSLKQLSSLQHIRTNDTNLDDDKLAIKITPVDAFAGTDIETLRFLAYINSYSEAYNGGWSDVKYAGRSEKFYIYTDFKRSVDIDFNIPCFTRDDLQTGHARLSKLSSILAGQYNGNYLGGVISKVTVGNYLVNQPGIINSLNYSPVENSPWDLDAKLAQYIKVTFNFTVLHNFLPEYGQPFINIPGATSDYLLGKQKEQELQETKQVFNQDINNIKKELQNDNKLKDPFAAEIESRREKRFNKINDIVDKNTASADKVKEVEVKQEKETKKSTAVQSRKDVGKTIPKNEEKEYVTPYGKPTGNAASINDPNSIFYKPKPLQPLTALQTTIANTQAYRDMNKTSLINPLTGLPFGIPFGKKG
jgi:hypothetical protein